MSVTQRPLKTGLPVSTQAPVQPRTAPNAQTPVGQTQQKQPVRTTDGAATVSETKALDVQAIPHAQQAGAVVLQAFTKTLRIPEREIKTRLGNLLGPVAATLGKPVNTPEALAAAQKTLQARFGPMGGLMYLQDAKDLLKQQPDIAKAATELKEFRAQLSGCKTLPQLLELADKSAGQPLPAICRNEMMKAMMSQATGKDKTAWVAAANFWEKTVAGNPNYKSDDFGREYYIVCLNKSGRAAESITHAREYVTDTASRSLGARAQTASPALLATQPGVNGEVLAGLGKAFHILADEAKKGPLSPEQQKLILSELKLDPAKSKDVDFAKAALDISTRYYHAGLSSDFEYYPGIVTIYNHYEMGEPDKANRLLPLVLDACERAGGKNTPDYWCLTTQVEVSLMAGKNDLLAAVLPKMLQKANVGWELSTTLDKMQMLAKVRDGKGEDTTTLRFVIGVLQERVGTLDGNQKQKDELQKAGGDVAALEATQKKESEVWLKATLEKVATTLGVRDVAPNAEQAKKEKLTNAVLSNSADFRSLMASHSVGGNFAFGGQIPDISVTRENARLARGLVHTWGLDKVTNPKEWEKKVDQKVQEFFNLEANGKRPLEDLHSPEHVIQDNYDRKRFVVAQSKLSGDNTTDIMSIAALGIGDCRPSNYFKALMFDAWQREVTINLRRKALDASSVGDMGKANSFISQAQEIERTQGRVFSVTIHAPVKMKQMYDWETDAKGNPVKSDKMEAVENHTFFSLVHLDKNGHVDTVEAQDAFYQKLYPLRGNKMNTDDFLREDGMIAGGKMGITNNQGEAIPFSMVCSKYSGSLMKESKVGSSDARYCGMTTAPMTTDQLVNTSQRDRLYGVSKGISELPV
jgi:hypothetical protein